MERSFNINTLVAFLAVVREGSVSSAAVTLNLTQPAVSHQIRRLSEETNSTLFERTATGLRITPEGAALVPKAEKVLAAFGEFKDSALRNAKTVRGTLRIGTIIDPEFIRLGQLLSHLRADYPDIQTELVHGVSGEILGRLKRKQIDAGFYLSSPDEPSPIETASKGAIQSVRLADFTYRVIAPAGWEARLENATWADLAALPWIGTPDSSSHHWLLKRVFEAHGCEQNVVSRVDQEASMLEMVRAGVGLALSRESIALHERQAFGLSMCDSVSIPACLSLAYLSYGPENLAMGALQTLIKRIW